MAHFITPSRHGYNVQFSPHNPDQLAVATSQHFGITGAGTLFILDLHSNNITKFGTLTWPSDGLFDVSWSLYDNDHLVTCSGDGVIQLWNLKFIHLPPMIYHDHKQEVSSVDWVKQMKGQMFISTSWDLTVKLWDATRQISISTYNGHTANVNQGVFSPHNQNCFASVGSDGFLKIWDITKKTCNINIRAHDSEVLSCDWSKHDPNVLATAASDRFIRGWDMRKTSQPVFQLKGHESVIQKVKFSPHYANILASVSYDFATKIWDLSQLRQNVETVGHHSEFVYGLDWNSLRKGQMADCAWDQVVHVFTPKYFEPGYIPDLD